MATAKQPHIGPGLLNANLLWSEELWASHLSNELQLIKKVASAEAAAPKEMRHGLEYSLYPDVCSLLLYLMCQAKLFFFFYLREEEKEEEILEKEEENISWTCCITSPALTADASLSLPSRHFSATLSHPPLFISVWPFLSPPSPSAVSISLSSVSL